jgi:prolyl 4-hydroxylase
MKPAMTRAAAAASLRGFEDVDDGREARAPADAAPKMSEDAARALREELEKLRQVPRAKVARPAHVPGSLADDVIDPSKIKVVSLNKPRAYVYESFLSDEEVKHVLDLAIQNGLSKSGVVNATTGGSTVSDIRTSTGTYIGKGHDGVIQRIENRIAAWSQIPVSHGESLQVLHYDPGQQYKPHFDYFFHDAGKKNNRIATVLLYLSDVEEGGETVFPKTNVPTSRDLSTFSECGNSGRSIKAKRGDALLFWSMTPGGELDSGSSHAGCPVIKGEKWTATKWMHVNPLGSLRDDVHKIFYEGGPESAVGCSDTNPQCHSWATGGECEKNPAYMRDACAMSCRVCQSGWRDGSYVKPATRE